MAKQDLLFEIGCEELPTHAVKTLAKELHNRLLESLNFHQLGYGRTQVFATPRRIAALITEVDPEQGTQKIARQGPAIQQAYDTQGRPTPAALGFAKSCGVPVAELSEKNQRLYYSGEKPGQKTGELLPEIAQQTIARMNIARPMRWGEHSESFARPVHWIVLLWGDTPVKTSLFGLESGNQTYGHRFHHPQALTITSPREYETILKQQGYVIANFEERMQHIRDAITAVTPPGLQVEMDEDLLAEVTALVEWPVALTGKFNPEFLQVPQEALITSMKVNQKYFPVLDAQGQLQARFILISNIESKDSETIIQGNERVLKARLTDAAFFYKNDLQRSLESLLPHLEHVTFQKQLGSVAHKTERMVHVSAWIGDKIKADIPAIKKAAQLSKSDLLSEMVNEFPTLQGTMGYYYAINDGLSKTTALAIKEHYLPRFFHDHIPSTKEGIAVSLAEKLDILVGIFGINQAPTGDKDPFALRRAANGILQMLITREKNPLTETEILNLDLLELLQQAFQAYDKHLPNPETVNDVFDFILVRLKSILQETLRVSAEQFESVMALKISKPLDFIARIQAVQKFQTLPEAAALAAANKRVSNILRKQATGFANTEINENLFEFQEEHELAQVLKISNGKVRDLVKQRNYTQALSELSNLKTPIDAFFDKVMVMVDNHAVKNNRLALLKNLQELLTQAADISHLSL